MAQSGSTSSEAVSRLAREMLVRIKQEARWLQPAHLLLELQGSHRRGKGETRPAEGPGSAFQHLDSLKWRDVSASSEGCPFDGTIWYNIVTTARALPIEPTVPATSYRGLPNHANATYWIRLRFPHSPRSLDAGRYGIWRSGPGNLIR